MPLEGKPFSTLEGKTAVVTGGSRGLGLGLVEALVARGARVTVVARDRPRLEAVARRLGVAVVAGDITDGALARQVVGEVRPDVLVLNAGVTPPLAPIHEHSWDSFRATWETDVKAGLFWIQEAIRRPLAPGSRVLVASSGAVSGSPLSGGHAGAKRMLWLMAQYANGAASDLHLGIRFQVLVPQQIIGETDHGRPAAEAYARRRGVSFEAFLAGFGAPLTPARYGELVTKILTDDAYQAGTAFGFKGDTGITAMD